MHRLCGVWFLPSSIRNRHIFICQLLVLLSICWNVQSVRNDQLSDETVLGNSSIATTIEASGVLNSHHAYTGSVNVSHTRRISNHSMQVPPGPSDLQYFNPQMFGHRRHRKHLEYKPPHEPKHNFVTDWIFAVGGGTGASVSSNRKNVIRLNWDMQRRMRYQDDAVIVLLVVVYFVSLFFGLSFTYWQCVNTQSAVYYADPRFHNRVSSDHGIESFLAAFNQSPKSVQLQVTGFVPVADHADGSVHWQGESYFVAFTFALDLSAWVVQLDQSELVNDSSGQSSSSELECGIMPEDLAQLRNFLAVNTNDLATVDMRKQIVWPGWEELATNIKLRIRQLGFDGLITINCNDAESIIVYKNRAWANFMHSRMTRVLCALSLLGWIIYLPYMWLRCTSMTVRVCYRIDMSITTYWELIADKLSANGFEANPSQALDSVPMAPPTRLAVRPGARQ